MSSTALYQAFIQAGASEDCATRAVEDVVQVSQLSQLATKTDIADVKGEIAALKGEIEVLRLATKTDIADVRGEIEALRLETKADIANLETRMLKWMVGCGILFVGVAIAGVGLLIQVMLLPGIAP